MGAAAELNQGVFDRQPWPEFLDCARCENHVVAEEIRHDDAPREGGGVATDAGHSRSGADLQIRLARGEAERGTCWTVPHDFHGNRAGGVLEDTHGSRGAQRGVICRRNKTAPLFRLTVGPRVNLRAAAFPVEQNHQPVIGQRHVALEAVGKVVFGNLHPSRHVNEFHFGGNHHIVGSGSRVK